jgi:hypothetical protein
LASCACGGRISRADCVKSGMVAVLRTDSTLRIHMAVSETCISSSIAVE